jgi:hypothetical protein
MEVHPLTRDEHVTAQIRAVVGEQKRRQTEVAQQAALSWPQWQRRMSGSVPWRIGEVVDVARVLDVPLDRLTGKASR